MVGFSPLIAAGRLAFALTILVVLSPFPVSGQQVATPQGVADTLTARGKNLTALKAVMSVDSTFDRGKSRQEIKGFLLYRRPADFRFQGVAPGGNPLFELLVKAEFFELYVPSEGKILKGGKKCFYERFPDVAELESLIPLILLQWKDVKAGELTPQGPDGLILSFTFKGASWRAVLDAKKFFVKRLDRAAGNKIDLTADFGDFGEGDHGWLPRRFDVRAPSDGRRTVVKISKFDVNPFLTETNFKLQPMFSPKIEECR
jgi:outer membrane lipoprotein-sorting protein